MASSTTDKRVSSSDGVRPAAAQARAVSALHRIVHDHLETFRAEAAHLREGEGLPRFVEEQFRAFLRCGWLAGGFARFRCGACGMERLVAFSCKGRGFCPSCGGRRMTERAAHLVDHVFPDVPVRQCRGPCAEAAARGLVARSRTPGARPQRLGDVRVEPGKPLPGACHARWGGFDLHAGLLVPAGQRDRLERVCRYVLRPPVAEERIRVGADGRVVLQLHHPWADGTTHVSFEPTAFSVSAGRSHGADPRCASDGRRGEDGGRVG